MSNWRDSKAGPLSYVGDILRRGLRNCWSSWWTEDVLQALAAAPYAVLGLQIIYSQK